MQRFTRENVVEVTKNYSDGEYDTYTLKVKKIRAIKIMIINNKKEDFKSSFLLVLYLLNN